MQRKHLIATLAVLALLLAVPPLLKSYGIYLFTMWVIFVIATMGLNLTVGYAGQKSLGHAAFFGIGAYTVAILLKAGFSFWLGLPLAMLGCFVIGLALGFPALRVQTIYLAFATLGFNTAVWLVMRNEEGLTGGTFGINGITRPELFGLDLTGALPYYYFVLAVALLRDDARRQALSAILPGAAHRWSQVWSISKAVRYFSFKLSGMPLIRCSDPSKCLRSASITLSQSP